MAEATYSPVHSSYNLGYRNSENVTLIFDPAVNTSGQSANIHSTPSRDLSWCCLVLTSCWHPLKRSITLPKQSTSCDVLYIAATNLRCSSPCIEDGTAHQCSIHGLAHTSPVRLHMVDEVLPAAEAPVGAGVFAAAALQQVPACCIQRAKPWLATTLQR